MTKAFSPAVLTDAAVSLAGFVGNTFLTSAVSNMAVVPAMLKTGWGSIVTGLLGAGGVGMAAQMVLPRQAGKIFAGAMMAPAMEGLKLVGLPGGATAGMDDWATARQVGAARSLETHMSGLDDFATSRQVASARALDSSMGEFGMNGMDF